MSPLALVYLLMASPIFHYGMDSSMTSEWNNRRWSNWTPESFNWEHESPMNWEHESSIFTTPFESILSNWRHAPVSRRSILGELVGVETPFEYTHHRHSMTPVHKMVKLNAIAKIIRRIAEVNPIMIEKVLSCPETRFVLSKVLRHVEPETLVLVEKMIKKTIPSYIREKVTRRVLKNLVRSNVFSSERSSILSELFPTTFERTFEESPIFSNIFSAAEESPLFSGVYSPKMISKIFSKIFSAEKSFSPKKIAKIVRLLKNVKNVESVSPIFSTLFSEESPIFSNIFSAAEESPIFSGVYSPKKVSKVVRRLLKNVDAESLLETSEVKSVEKLILKKLVKKVIRNPYTRVHFCENVCENVVSGYSTYSAMPVRRICDEVCPMTSRFSERLSWF